jgi:PPOX class probable F420-dependent enzyme
MFEQQPVVLGASQRAFLDEVHYGVVGTLNADGSIQQTVVWYLLDGDVLRFSVGASSVKAHNLRRSPTITLTVEAGARYLSLSGHAQVEPVDPALRLRMATRYLGAERAEAWLQKQPEKPRASVRMIPLRVYGQGV